MSCSCSGGPHVCTGSYGIAGSVIGEHVVDHPPRRLDAVLAGEQQRLAVERVAEQPLVRRRLAGVVVAEVQLDVLARRSRRRAS